MSSNELMDNAEMEREIFKKLTNKDLDNMFRAGVRQELVEKEIFRRYDYGDRDTKVELVTLMPFTFLVEFGIENLTLEEVYALNAKLDEFTEKEARQLSSFKNAPVPRHFDPNDIVQREVTTRLNDPDCSDRDKIVALIFDKELVKEEIGLEWLEEVFPSLPSDILDRYMDDTLEFSELEEWVDEHMTEEEYDLYVLLTPALKKDPELLKDIWEHVATNGNFLYDEDLWSFILVKE